jgi:aspartyl-tRNA(Asn)/glutamyl-tRNA(Gln) amidotransferase subunit A
VGADAAIPTIAEAARAIADGALSPVELTQACLDRIEAVDGDLNAFVLLRAEEALAEARKAEAEIRADGPRGPLHGIPIGIKDIYETAGIRTIGQSRLRLDYVPDQDATAANKLAEAGTVLLGKLTTHEFAMGGPSFDLPFPPARNPWDTTRFTGGSSSGSGAAVAAGLCLGALGTDTGGSVRTPSAFCGLAGLKPTYGRVSRAGVFPLVASMDHCGPLAWTVEDCALILAAIAGPDPRDRTAVERPVPDYRAALTGDLSGLSFGAVRHFYEDDPATTPEAKAAIDAALDQLAGLGASVEEVRLSPLDDYHACGLTMILAETFAVHQKDLLERPQEYGECFRHRALLGAFIEAADYLQATRLRRKLTEELDAALADHDVLVTAMTFGPAPPLEAITTWTLIEKPVPAMVANVGGHPALVQCCGFSPDGLPLSVQIIGRRFDEETVLRVGDAYERATPWRQRRPAL